MSLVLLIFIKMSHNNVLSNTKKSDGKCKKTII